MTTKKVLYGGFSFIKFNDNDNSDNVCGNHRESTKEKGKKLVEAGHIFDVREIREISGIEIFGFCLRETNIRDKPYKVVLSLDQERKVQDSKCQCRSGLTGDCKHTAGLVYFINTERQESQTDHKCTWRTPSQYGQKLYPKGKTFDEIFGMNQPKATFQPPAISDQESHLNLLKKYGDFNSTMFQMLTAKEKVVDCAATSDPLPQWFDEIFQPLYLTNPQTFELSDDLKNYYKQSVQISRDKIRLLCEMTTEQGHSILWRQERKSRITASRAHKILHARSDKKRVEYFLDHRSLEHITHIRRGIELEPFARKQYEDLFNIKVTKSGLVVKDQQQWLAASPDGLFRNDRGICILEIKCPEKIEVSWLTEDGQLKEKDPYFTQIQLTMYVCNAISADLFIYTKESYKLVKVSFNKKFC